MILSLYLWDPSLSPLHWSMFPRPAVRLFYGLFLEHRLQSFPNKRYTGSEFFDLLNDWNVLILSIYLTYLGFPGGSEVKASACNVGDLGSIPGSGRSPGEGNGNPLQYSCLENPMDGGAWRATVHGVAKSWTRLSDFTFTFTFCYLQFSIWIPGFFMCTCIRLINRQIERSLPLMNLEHTVKTLGMMCSLTQWLFVF